jgi:hypothetical protein
VVDAAFQTLAQGQPGALEDREAWSKHVQSSLNREAAVRELTATQAQPALADAPA